MSDKAPETRTQRERRVMRAALSRIIEEGDADAALLLVSFHRSGSTYRRLMKFGNGMTCAKMVADASDHFDDIDFDPFEATDQ